MEAGTGNGDVIAQWDETLGRISRGGAQVVVILPLWFEMAEPHSDVGTGRGEETAGRSMRAGTRSHTTGTRDRGSSQTPARAVAV